MSEFDGRAFARSLSTGPGVYVMRDAEGKVLYVGKARNLRRRVGSYFDRRDKGARINLMVRRIAAIEVSLTRTEAEALLLENEWIKAHKPRFNINLRDDKSYPWIRIDTSHRYPRIGFYRGNRSAPGRYFGPYSSAGAVRESLNQIYRLMGLRQCRDSVFENRTRPCLQYQINRCSAPCVGYISEADYARDVEAAAQLLKGRNEEVIEHLTERMQAASAALEFEKAASLRDHIESLQRVRSNQYVTDGAEELDVIALHCASGRAAVQVVEFRHGRNVGARTFFPGNLGGEERSAEVFGAFLGQYYADRRPPAEILASEEPEQAELWKEALSARREGPVSIRWRVRGQRAQWLALAATNAEDALRRRLAERDQVGRGLSELAELIDLPAPPEHLECFDISHISGTETVASCVVFGPEGAMKKNYRHYNIEGITPGDDYAAMDQVLRRRYRRLVEEQASVPDLIVIDGGKGQANRAREVLADLGLEAIPVMGVAKGPARKAGYETFVLGDREVRPGPHHPASHLIQQIRDEAHRFAITGHRRRRQKRAQSSPLEQIPGIGPKRRQALLKHFGGLKGLKKAGPDELARLPGISQALADRITEALRKL
ncbi:excinuclease ABC subunit UvrC [Wenzhouxiangella marina]|uniref:UvrABC system protein C n=1 Tax=Wenzhouxiangella marina TaxID=1579979 RepID=A0A0K0XX29_9GAMM|nr:excinuclease ABC subunit UvrC [Wenzhouxiangella marina]AKS42186.1 excinuclease ABC subunit C [Wenzhouxiangella marina]MBB6086042.1 excinuclease ABC subunit C [Wenzhouxiangella marina]